MELSAIEVDSVVSIHYSLTVDGQPVDSSDGGEPLPYLHGHGNLVPGLEQELTGKRRGDKFSVSVPPEHGYGEQDPEGVQQVPRGHFPDEIDLTPGATLRGETNDGEPVMLRVIAVEGDDVTIDLNHPLAGKTLEFQIEVVEIRSATQEELQHGHVHGPGGHEH